VNRKLIGLRNLIFKETIMKSRHLIHSRTLLSLAVLGATLAIGGNALAKGGTAKPPTNPPGAFVVTPALSEPLLFPAVPGPGATALSVPPLNLSGFDATGVITDATVDSNLCSGTAKMDNKTIIIPCGLIVQMPANTLTWADYVNGGPATNLEMSAIGNKVGNDYIAALIYVSQQSLHGGSGYITSIDYIHGNIIVDGATTIQINDPNGRFGRAQSPDPRFSVDDQNPTIKSGTGYPMCVPRTDPAITNDPLCPQKNRPTVITSPSSPMGCRNFTASLTPLPVSGELPGPVAGQVYCSQYVMAAVAGAIEYPSGTVLPATSFKARPNDNFPDPRQQVPFEVGDFISYAGTFFPSSASWDANTVSAHTIEANLGIYTQPSTQPAYIAIGDFGIGTVDLGAGATAINGAGIETTNRIFLEASTTDVKTPVDIYLVDDTPFAPVRQRWVTPYDMTGECNPAQTLAASCGGASGGITTQNTGPQPMRARIRATKAPLGLLNQPTRTARVMQRSLCRPVNPVNQRAPDQQNILPIATSVDSCLAAAPVTANNLVAGQYLAPVFEFIFPENVKAGDPIIPNDLWHLPFLRNGEAGTPALSPQPW
jgi:hypothetical protein